MASSEPASHTRQWRLAAILLVGVVGALSLAYYWFLSGSWAVLAQQLRTEEAATIVAELKKQEIPYELKDGGTTIMVPARQADSARIDISSSDIPLKGTVGFELFNKSDMGLTDFAQKVNYQRALQGEIARTIMSMDGVAYARVHIAIPERSLFRVARSEPRAAVTITPQVGAGITAERIAGIQRLVAATVPDLALDQVAILNERGELLTPEFSDAPGAAGSESALEANYRDRVARVVADAAPRAHLDFKITTMSRQQNLASAISNPARSGAARDHSIRIVLFKRSVLSPGQEQAIRRAIDAELGLDRDAGDQLSFSPAPEIARAMPPMPMGTAAMPTADGGRSSSEQERFMANVASAWTVAFWLLAVAGGLLGFMLLRRRRQHRRLEFVQQIRQQLLLVDGAIDAA